MGRTQTHSKTFCLFPFRLEPLWQDTLSLSGESKVLCRTRGGKGGGAWGCQSQKRHQKKMTAGRRPFMGSPSLPKTPSLPYLLCLFAHIFRATIIRQELCEDLTFPVASLTGQNWDSKIIVK